MVIWTRVTKLQTAAVSLRYFYEEILIGTSDKLDRGYCETVRLRRKMYKGLFVNFQY